MRSVNVVLIREDTEGFTLAWISSGLAKWGLRAASNAWPNVFAKDAITYKLELCQGNCHPDLVPVSITNILPLGCVNVGDLFLYVLLFIGQ